MTAWPRSFTATLSVSVIWYPGRNSSHNGSILDEFCVPDTSVTPALYLGFFLIYVFNLKAGISIKLNPRESINCRCTLFKPLD